MLAYEIDGIPKRVTAGQIVKIMDFAIDFLKLMRHEDLWIDIIISHDVPVHVGGYCNGVDEDIVEIEINGNLDFDEFASHELPHGDHQTFFNLIDTDNNGVISQDEFDNHKPPCPKHAKGGRHD